MKKILLGCTLLLFLFSAVQAQTTLTRGDIAFTGINSDAPDGFMFVLLQDVTAGTAINFTDNGWFAAGGFRANEGTITVTFDAAAPAGTEVAVDITADTATASNGAAMSYAAAGGSINFSSSGDQIFAYQGAAPTSGSDCSFLAGINIDGSEGTPWQADAANSNTSALPEVLLNGVHAVGLGEIDNAIFDRSTVSGTTDDLRAAINDAANWTLDNGGAFTLTPMAFTVTAISPAPAPMTPTVAADMTICPGESASITVTSSDAAANEYVLFTGSCGGTEIDRNASGMFTVMPTMTTDYFVAGSACDGTLSACATVTVMSDETPPTLTVPADVTLEFGADTDVISTGEATATDNCSGGMAVMPWINEFHYDNTGGDVNEFIEIAGPAGFDLTGWSISLYNGSNGQLYDTDALSGILNDDQDGYGFAAIFYPANGLQNGNDAIALVDADGNVVQFLSYEGAFTAVGGPADGLTAEDVGVEEPGTTPVGFSLQLTGTGGQYEDFTWADPAAQTSLAPNNGQTFVAPTGGVVEITFTDAVAAGVCANESVITRTFTATDASGNTATATQTITVEDNQAPIIIADATATAGCQDDTTDPNIITAASAFDPGTPGAPMSAPFINEFHYDNAGGDVNEFIEVAGVVGTNLDGFTLVLYNGSNGSIYNTLNLSGTLTGGSGGFGFTTVVLPTNGLQNGGPDGIALVDADGNVVEFLSYEGTFTATEGPADGQTSTDIGVSEGGGTQVGFSLQRTGTGAQGSDFSFVPAEETPGEINQGQSSALTGDLEVTFEDTESNNGQIITRVFTATDACDNTTTFTQIITLADLAPRLQCRQPTSTVTSEGLCVNNTLTLLPPFIFDDCGFGDEVTLTSDAPSEYPIGTTVVTFTATNSTGSTSCETEVIISAANPADVDCGFLTINANTENPNSCFAQATLEPTVLDFCGTTPPSVSGAGTFSYTPGTITTQNVTITEADGTETVCTYTINAHDTFAPVITNCPDDITAAATGELTQVNLPVPTATDNCGVDEIVNDAPEDGFPVGTTTVTFMVKDEYGQWASCSYDVTVTPNLTFAAMSDIEASLEAEGTTARVAWNEPTAATVCVMCAETEIDDYRYLGVYRGHQYFLFEGENTTRANAAAMAESLDAQLVTINSASENRFLQNALGEDISGVWTGLSNGDALQWLTDEAVDFANIAEDYTAAEGENFGLLQNDGTWIFADAAAQYGFLAERPCVNFEQITPVQIDAETGEETLLTCGDDFVEGTYEVTYRATDMCGNEAEYTFDVTVETPTAEICTTGANESVVYIDNVLMGEYEIATGDDAGFGDYTQDEMVLYAVIDEETADYTPVSVNITAGGNEATEELFYRVWLDKNHDGDFFDADEMLTEGSAFGDWTTELPAFTENMEVTRMRVMVAKHDYPEVCGNVAAGEAEDYTVSILETIVRPGDDTRGNDNGTTTPPVILDAPSTAGQLFAYPNPVTDKLTVNVAQFVGQNVEITLTNQLGQVMTQQRIDNVQTETETLRMNRYAAGFYTLTLTTGAGEVQTVKVVKR